MMGAPIAPCITMRQGKHTKHKTTMVILLLAAALMNVILLKSGFKPNFARLFFLNNRSHDHYYLECTTYEQAQLLMISKNHLA